MPKESMMRLQRFSRLLLLAAIWHNLSATALRAQILGDIDQPLTAEQVRESIAGGVKYLLEEQDPNRGNWDDLAPYPGGVTALCTLALLNSGVDPNDPQIQLALEYLRKIPPTKTYSTALQTMVFCAADPGRDQPLIQRNVGWLESNQLANGSWSYPSGEGDNSNSQFAVLALHEAERVGAQVPRKVWEKAAEYWSKTQNPDGSWGYTRTLTEGLGSMTCAGIGATVVCDERVRSADAGVKNGLVQCCRPHVEDDSLERALKWLGRNFSVRRNPGRRNMRQVWHYYFLYGLERVGRFTAQRFIGDHDWYREGAEYLVRQQDPFSHHWVGESPSEDSPHIATSYALLFLSKGRRPVLMAKLSHGPDEDWNNHENDMANLTAYVEDLWDLDMTWQVIDPRTASVDDLLQAPVLFVSGSRTPDLDSTAQKIRDYLDRGGFLFAEACCLDGGQFEAGFRRFVDKVFPEEEYQLRRAGPEHPLWRVEKLVRPDSPYVSRLWTVEYGCRTCVVFSEIDLSCYWELNGRTSRPEYPDTIEKRLQDAMDIGANVLSYATNREPKGKEASFVAPIDPAELSAAGSRGTIQIAKLQHGGGCNDAPGALLNLLRTAVQGDLRLQVATKEFPVRADDPLLERFVLTFMHGRHDFRFTPKEKESLREYLINGGTLFADSICASPQFTAAFKREIEEVLPSARLERIPVTDPLFSSAAGGYDIRKVHRRDPVERGANETLASRTREVEPELLGIQIDGRWAVIFSPYDISCALEQHEAIECRGYTRDDAARIGLNVLMYTLNPDAG